jgi:hypothetical protein
MWTIVELKVLEGSRLWLRFADGLSGEIDLGPDLWGPLGEPLRDPALFAAVQVDEFGALAWPNGFDAAPDALWQDLKARQGGTGLAA